MYDEGDPASQESIKNKEVVVPSATSFSTKLGRDRLVPVPKPYAEARNGQPSSNEHLNYMREESMALVMDANSAKNSSNTMQKRQVLSVATEGDGSSARKRPKMTEVDASSSSAKIHEPGQRPTSEKKDFYSKTAAKIRETGFPTPKESTSCTCQAELQELRKAVNKMNDSLGGLTQKLEEVIKKLDTMGQDAKIHRKGTQRLIAAANGEETLTDSEDDA